MDGISRVYAIIDSDNCVIQLEGEYTLNNISDLDHALLIEQGPPCDRLNLAQTHYLAEPLFTSDGIPQYMWDGVEILKRPGEAIEADRAAIPQDISPTIDDLVEAINILTDLVLSEDTE